MATTFKTFLNNDITSTKTLLHEAIPMTGTIVSGTYSDNNIKNYAHGMFQSVYDYPYLSSSANHIFDLTVGYATALSGASNTQKAKKLYPNDKIVFCNGGDRNNNNCPEMSVDGIEFEFSVGGDNKANSSSWILKKWQEDSHSRTWGTYSNLYQDEGVKVKELIVMPNQGMSFQRHFKRNEIWCVTKGECIVKHSISSPDEYKLKKLKKPDSIIRNCGDWHQIINKSKDECKIIEIQYGDETEESDIERLYYYEDENE